MQCIARSTLVALVAGLLSPYCALSTQARRPDNFVCQNLMKWGETGECSLFTAELHTAVLEHKMESNLQGSGPWQQNCRSR